MSNRDNNNNGTSSGTFDKIMNELIENDKKRERERKRMVMIMENQSLKDRK